MPGATVEARGLVAEDEALATIEANGTAVGFVDKGVKVREGVKVGVVITVPGIEGVVPDIKLLDEVADEVADETWVVDDPPVKLPLAVAWRAA